jgi:hypothetical protein
MKRIKRWVRKRWFKARPGDIWLMAQTIALKWGERYPIASKLKKGEFFPVPFPHSQCVYEDEPLYIIVSGRNNRTVIIEWDGIEVFKADRGIHLLSHKPVSVARFNYGEAWIDELLNLYTDFKSKRNREERAKRADVATEDNSLWPDSEIETWGRLADMVMSDKRGRQ